MGQNTSVLDFRERITCIMYGEKCPSLCFPTEKGSLRPLDDHHADGALGGGGGGGTNRNNNKEGEPTIDVLNSTKKGSAASRGPAGAGGVGGMTTKEEEEFWKVVFLTQMSQEDVAAFFCFDDMRKLRRHRPWNLVVVLMKCLEQLEGFIGNHQQITDYQAVLTALRVITTALPYAMEDLNAPVLHVPETTITNKKARERRTAVEAFYSPFAEDFAQHFFWEGKVCVGGWATEEGEVGEGKSQQGLREEEEEEQNSVDDAAVVIRNCDRIVGWEVCPPGVRLMQALDKLCFIPHFTIGGNQRLVLESAIELVHEFGTATTTGGNHHQQQEKVHHHQQQQPPHHLQPAIYPSLLWYGGLFSHGMSMNPPPPADPSHRSRTTTTTSAGPSSSSSEAGRGGGGGVGPAAAKVANAITGLRPGVKSRRQEVLRCLLAALSEPIYKHPAATTPPDHHHHHHQHRAGSPSKGPKKGEEEEDRIEVSSSNCNRTTYNAGKFFEVGVNAELCPFGPTLCLSLVNCVVSYDASGILPFSSYLGGAETAEKAVSSALQVLGVYLEDPKHNEIRKSKNLGGNIYWATMERLLQEDVQGEAGTSTEALNSWERKVVPRYVQVANALYRIIRNPLAASTTWIHSSQKLIHCHSEAVHLVHRLLMGSKLVSNSFGAYVASTVSSRLLFPLLHFVQEGLWDNQCFGEVRVVLLILLQLTAEKKFLWTLDLPLDENSSAAWSLNLSSSSSSGKGSSSSSGIGGLLKKKHMPLTTLPEPGVGGTFGDVLVLGMCIMLSPASPRWFRPLTTVAATILCNVSTSVKTLTEVTCFELQHSLTFVSQPRLIAGHRGSLYFQGVTSLLVEAIANLLQYSHSGVLPLAGALAVSGPVIVENDGKPHHASSVDVVSRIQQYVQHGVVIRDVAKLENAPEHQYKEAAEAATTMMNGAGGGGGGGGEHQQRSTTSNPPSPTITEDIPMDEIVDGSSVSSSSSPPAQQQQPAAAASPGDDAAAGRKSRRQSVVFKLSEAFLRDTPIDIVAHYANETAKIIATLPQQQRSGGGGINTELFDALAAAAAEQTEREGLPLPSGRGRRRYGGASSELEIEWLAAYMWTIVHHRNVRPPLFDIKAALLFQHFVSSKQPAKR